MTQTCTVSTNSFFYRGKKRRSSYVVSVGMRKCTFFLLLWTGMKAWLRNIYWVRIIEKCSHLHYLNGIFLALTATECRRHPEDTQIYAMRSPLFFLLFKNFESNQINDTFMYNFCLYNRHHNKHTYVNHTGLYSVSIVRASPDNIIIDSTLSLMMNKAY